MTTPPPKASAPDTPHFSPEAIAEHGHTTTPIVVTGLPGVVIEVKAHREMDLAEWMDETEVERANAGAELAVCWHKRRRKGSPADWYVTMTGTQFVALLKDFSA